MEVFVNTIGVGNFVIALAALILVLWRISYGFSRGLAAEAAGLVAVLAAAAGVWFAMGAFSKFKQLQLGDLPRQVIMILIAAVIYKVMMGIAKASTGVNKVAIIGGVNRLLGGILGLAEGAVMLWLIRFITAIPILDIWKQALDTLLYQAGVSLPF